MPAAVQFRVLLHGSAQLWSPWDLFLLLTLPNHVPAANTVLKVPSSRDPLCHCHQTEEDRSHHLILMIPLES